MRGQKVSYKINHREINGVLEKQCNRCNEWLPCTNEYFYKNDKNKTDGLYPYCIKCTKNKTVLWQNEKRNRNSVLESRKKSNAIPERKQEIKGRVKTRRNEGKYLEWQRNNKDKVKTYIQNKMQHGTHSITKKEWKTCKNYFNNECAYCGLPITEHYRTYRGELQHCDLHKEHVNHFGANNLSNCIPSCMNCNSQKWEFELDYWYNKDNINYTENRYNKIIQWIAKDYLKYIITEC